MWDTIWKTFLVGAIVGGVVGVCKANGSKSAKAIDDWFEKGLEQAFSRTAPPEPQPEE